MSENIVWDKDPMLLRRRVGGFILIVGSMLYFFAENGGLEKAEPLTEGVLKVILESTGDPKLNAMAEAAAKFKARMKKGKENV